jgi:Iap family predicted aminopeptidase
MMNTTLTQIIDDLQSALQGALTQEEKDLVLSSRVDKLIPLGLQYRKALAALADEIEFKRLRWHLSLFKQLGHEEQAANHRREALLFRQQIGAVEAVSPIAQENETARRAFFELLQADHGLLASEIFRRIDYSLETLEDD